MMSIVISMIFTALLVFIFRFLNKKNEPPLLGVYQQRNKLYFVKFLIMFVILGIKQLYSYLKRRLAIELGKSDDGTMHVHTEDAASEESSFLGDHPMGVDAVYFNGTSKAGAVLTCNVARRRNGACDAFLLLKVEDGELLLSPRLPDTDLQQKNTDGDLYSVDGIIIKNLIPMRSWNINYIGEMKPKSDPSKTVKVELALTWSTAFPPFNYKNISALSMAKDIAREPWSRNYFRILKKHEQLHYEQMGEIEGTATIDGKVYSIHMPCARDHTFSKHLDWRNFHRYVYHFIYLENGDSIAVGSASQPQTISHLTVGYYCRKSDQSVWPITSSSFHLYQHGERQILPKDYGFSFTSGWQEYFVQVLVKDEEIFYIGKEREAKFYERWASFQVNGIEGWGSVEWHYNNVAAVKTEKRIVRSLMT